MKLYDLYCVISNKIVRRGERQYRCWRDENVPGVLVKTARGWFIDGHEVDKKAKDTWFALRRAAHTH